MICSISKAKVLKEGNIEYQCNPKKTCEDKLIMLERQVQILKKKLTLQEKYNEVEYIYIEKEIEVNNKHQILSLYGVSDVTDTSVFNNNNKVTARTETAYIPGISYQYQFDSNFVPLIGINTNSHILFGLGYRF